MFEEWRVVKLPPPPEQQVSRNYIVSCTTSGRSRLPAKLAKITISTRSFGAGTAKVLAGLATEIIYREARRGNNVM